MIFLAIIYILLQIGDIITTKIALKMGFKEWNPINKKMSNDFALAKIMIGLWLLFMTIIGDNEIINLIIFGSDILLVYTLGNNLCYIFFL